MRWGTLTESRASVKSESMAYQHETACKFCGEPIRYEDQWEVTPATSVPLFHPLCKRKKKYKCKAKPDAKRGTKAPCVVCGREFILTYGNEQKCPGPCKRLASLKCSMCGRNFWGLRSSAYHECESCKPAASRARRQAWRKSPSYGTLASFAKADCKQRIGACAEKAFDLWALKQGWPEPGPTGECNRGFDKYCYIPGHGHCGVQIKNWRKGMKQSEQYSLANSVFRATGDECSFVAFVDYEQLRVVMYKRTAGEGN